MLCVCLLLMLDVVFVFACRLLWFAALVGVCCLVVSVNSVVHAIF